MALFQDPFAMGEHQRFHKGNYKKEAEEVTTSPRIDKGWLFGDFIQHGPRKTAALELKYWKLDKGQDRSHRAKENGEPVATECTLILEGKVRGSIDGQTVYLSAGEYVLIHPRVPSNLVEEVIESVVGMTIKAPSNPGNRARGQKNQATLSAKDGPA
jgi:quercetin dioxygenase-like cupin family protein